MLAGVLELFSCCLEIDGCDELLEEGRKDVVGTDLPPLKAFGEVEMVPEGSGDDSDALIA